jgi:hypothetical protein
LKGKNRRGGGREEGEEGEGEGEGEGEENRCRREDEAGGEDRKTPSVTGKISCGQSEKKATQWISPLSEFIPKSKVCFVFP